MLSVCCIWERVYFIRKTPCLAACEYLVHIFSIEWWFFSLFLFLTVVNSDISCHYNNYPMHVFAYRVHTHHLGKNIKLPVKLQIFTIVLANAKNTKCKLTLNLFQWKRFCSIFWNSVWFFIILFSLKHLAFEVLKISRFYFELRKQMISFF